jgi:hypothetical protein
MTYSRFRAGCQSRQDEAAPPFRGQQCLQTSPSLGRPPLSSRSDHRGNPRRGTSSPTLEILPAPHPNPLPHTLGVDFDHRREVIASPVMGACPELVFRVAIFARATSLRALKGPLALSSSSGWQSFHRRRLALLKIATSPFGLLAMTVRGSGRPQKSHREPRQGRLPWIRFQGGNLSIEETFLS